MDVLKRIAFADFLPPSQRTLQPRLIRPHAGEALTRLELSGSPYIIDQATAVKVRGLVQPILFQTISVRDPRAE